MLTEMQLLTLLQVCDSTFPIGAFTLSNGLETYVQKGIVHDLATLGQFINAHLNFLAHGDLALISLAWKNADDISQICQMDLLCSALKAAAEIRRGSQKLCARFIKAVEFMGGQQLEEYQNAIRQGHADGHHCIAFGIYAKKAGVDQAAALTAFAYNSLSAVVTNGVKLVPLSQLGGQKLIKEAFPLLYQSVNTAKALSLQQLGLTGMGLEIRAMQHEQLYSRLYIS